MYLEVVTIIKLSQKNLFVDVPHVISEYTKRDQDGQFCLPVYLIFDGLFVFIMKEGKVHGFCPH